MTPLFPFLGYFYYFISIIPSTKISSTSLPILANSNNRVILNTVAFPQTRKRGIKKCVGRGERVGDGGGGMSQARTSVPIIPAGIFKTKSAPGSSWARAVAVSDPLLSAWVTVGISKHVEKEGRGDLVMWTSLLQKEWVSTYWIVRLRDGVCVKRRVCDVYGSRFIKIAIYIRKYWNTIWILVLCVDFIQGQVLIGLLVIKPYSTANTQHLFVSEHPEEEIRK